MECELWAELSAAVSVVEPSFFDNPEFEHSTACVVRVHLWAVLHDRPTVWACRRQSWDSHKRPARLPSQSTMSRRLRSDEFKRFMERLQTQLSHLPGAGELFKRLDGKPLMIAAHSTDSQAGWGRGAGQKAKGYKLHAIWAGRAMPQQWRVAPMNVSETEMARRMIRRLDGCGYIVADKGYDSNSLFDLAAAHGHQLLCHRRYGTHRGLGHHRHSPQRLRSRTLLEEPTASLSGFGPREMKHRKQIERDFGNCVSFGGGLNGLPSWVRGHGRARRWVWAKLLVNAARIRIKARKSSKRA